MNAALFVGQSAANMRLPPLQFEIRAITGFTSIIESVHTY
jgi:hypothetical protein